jgi:hypothetical protein
VFQKCKFAQFWIEWPILYTQCQLYSSAEAQNKPQAGSLPEPPGLFYPSLVTWNLSLVL